MILTGVIAAIVTAFLLLGGLFATYCVVKRRILKAAREFLTQPDEKTPSQLAILFDNMAFILSQRLVLQLKTTFMGMTSVDVKNDQRAAEAEVIAANPAIGVLLSLIPGARRILKNPALMSLAAGAFSKLSTGN